MRDDDALLLLLLGAAVMGGPSWGDGWVWPVAPLLRPGGRFYRPVITDGWGSARGSGIHRGVDVMFRRASSSDASDFRAGTSDGTKLFFAPRHTPVIAARAGRVWSVGPTPNGVAVVIDHGKPWSTFYTHLESSLLPSHAGGVSVATKKETIVKAGDIIGWMGFSPIDPQRIRHLHFEVWHGGASDHATDPAAAMTRWPAVAWTFKA
jgi:murein DD-endopeptidase MepM/ murein hydrolase activator NlpD